jgi:hypothetical protein
MKEFKVGSVNTEEEKPRLFNKPASCKHARSSTKSPMATPDRGAVGLGCTAVEKIPKGRF